MPTKREPWHLDRRVPVALIVTILLQTAGIVWWASDLTSRVSVLEKQVETRALVNERLARMEEKFESVDQSLARIESWLRRLLERPNP